MIAQFERRFNVSVCGCAIKFLRVIRAGNATKLLLYIDEFSPFLLKVSRLLRGPGKWLFAEVPS